MRVQSGIIILHLSLRTVKIRRLSGSNRRKSADRAEGCAGICGCRTDCIGSFLTFCGGIEFQYDNGTGYQSVESVELSQDNFTVVIKKDVKN